MKNKKPNPPRAPALAGVPKPTQAALAMPRPSVALPFSSAIKSGPCPAPPQDPIQRKIWEKEALLFHIRVFGKAVEGLPEDDQNWQLDYDKTNQFPPRQAMHKLCLIARDPKCLCGVSGEAKFNREIFSECFGWDFDDILRRLSIARREIKKQEVRDKAVMLRRFFVGVFYHDLNGQSLEKTGRPLPDKEILRILEPDCKTLNEGDVRSARKKVKDAVERAERERAKFERGHSKSLIQPEKVKIKSAQKRVARGKKLER